MIRILKADEPTVLVENRAKWTEEFLHAKQAGGKIPDSIHYRYRHPEIKIVIMQEAAGKCAYCESKVGHVSPGDVEHVLPSSKVPEFAFRWSNLVLSCAECNRRKRDYYDSNEPLVHPVADDPKEHLRFFGSLLWPVPGSGLGHMTITELDLNRTALVERRQDRLITLLPLLNTWNDASPRKKRLLAEQIIRETRGDKEYSAMTAAFISTMCPALT